VNYEFFNFFLQYHGIVHHSISYLVLCSNDLSPSAANIELPFPYIFLSASDCKCVWSCLSIEVVRWWSTYWIGILLAGEGFSSSSETGKNA
jgi:hypothetical protein